MRRLVLVAAAAALTAEAVAASRAAEDAARASSEQCADQSSSEPSVSAGKAAVAAAHAEQVPAGEAAEAATAGDISSVFSHLQGEEYEWPARYAELKSELRAAFAPDSLEASFARLNSSLERWIGAIEREGHGLIPQLAFDGPAASSSLTTLGRHTLPRAVADRIRARGVVVVRRVVPAASAREWKRGIEEYARRNPSHVGFPSDDPQARPRA